ncbi:MAG: hypothetical protein QOJ46_1828 [bacterium]|jgi:hypothetical protein
MAEHAKPADATPVAPAGADSQDSASRSSGGDLATAAEAHLAGVDMAARRAIHKQSTK